MKYLILLLTLSFLLVSCTNIQPSNQACTSEGKICPDGTVVGRVGPNCEFEACPPFDEIIYEEGECTEEQRNVDACIEIYQPVCGWFKDTTNCLVYPCANTYSNSCHACMDETVARWTEGKCPEDKIIT